MANHFKADQRLSQNEDGSILTLIDFSNYNDIDENLEDNSVNSQGNDDNVSVNGFVSRKWILEDIEGNLEEVVFPYDLKQINKCSILIDKDKYLSITMSISTAMETYTSVIETGLHRQAEYKLYVLSSKTDSCYSIESDRKSVMKNDASNLIDSAKFKVLHFDNEGFNDDINASNALLDHLLLSS